jgi:hypothetical protein
MFHLPLGFLEIKAAFAPSSFSDGISLAKFGSLKLLLVALLPPVSSLGSLSLSALKAKKMAQKMALQQQTEVAEATVESITALLRASSIHGGEVFLSHKKMYFLKVLSRKTNITINLERVASTFEAKLSGCTPPELSYCATLLLRRKLVLDAMVPPRCFKQTGAYSRLLLLRRFLSSARTLPSY